MKPGKIWKEENLKNEYETVMCAKYYIMKVKVILCTLCESSTHFAVKKQNLNYFDFKGIPEYIKTAFLFILSISASEVLKCDNWTISQLTAVNCIISPFENTVKRVTEKN